MIAAVSYRQPSIAKVRNLSNNFWSPFCFYILKADVLSMVRVYVITFL